MPPIYSQNNTFFRSLIQQSHSICLHILSHIETHLHLSAGALTSLHRITALSSDQIRILKMSPQPPNDGRTSLLPHTDFGTFTILWNVVGGLQTLPREAGDSDPDGVSEKWEYVKPEEGCAVVNVGDALVNFTNGVVRSNLHRVTTPPGTQALLERYSVAYFMRPEDEVSMRPLEGGDVIPGEQEEGKKIYTAREWVGLKSDAARKSTVGLGAHNKLGLMKSLGGRK
jgi:isopenicillin N synthase-like dioxygenase